MLPCGQELKKKQSEQQRKQAAKDIRLSAYTAEADLNVSLSPTAGCALCSQRCCALDKRRAVPAPICRQRSAQPPDARPACCGTSADCHAVSGPDVLFGNLCS